jgi:hypothetical protein
LFRRADVAQLAEQCFRKAKVGGSIPPIGSNMKHRYSRLASSEEKRNMRRATTFVALTIVAVILIFTVGIPVMAKFAGFIGDLRKSSTPVDINDKTPPPPPAVENLPEYTNQQKLGISGSSESGAAVKLFYNTSEEEVVAGEDGKFTFSIILSKGANDISLSSCDTSGNESAKTTSYTIVFDNEPPDLSIDSPSDGASFFGTKQRQITVLGTTETAASITINDRPIKVADDGSFSYTTTLGDGNNDFNIKAFDKAGNTTENKISVNYSP